MLTDIINEYEIYSDSNLRRFIYDLENRFMVRDETLFFSQLVNFSENKDIPYHGWFKYREGFSHTLVKELIHRCGLSMEEYVLDPFCGCGTTVIEAALNGYSGIGIDINPVSAFLSKVKCRRYTDDEICRIHMELPAFLKKIRRMNMSFAYQEKYKDVQRFFTEHNFERLISIKQVLDQCKGEMDQNIYDLFFCGYISIIEEVSDRKRDGNGLKTSKTKIEDVETFYLKKLNEMVEDIEKYRIPEDVVSILECGDAMKLTEIVRKYAERIQRLPGAIIYSPPYANSFDYFESYKMEVILADYAADMKGVSVYRQKAIESFVGRLGERSGHRNFITWMSDEIEAAIPEKEARTGKTDHRTRKVPKMIKGYFEDMEKVIMESSRILAQGKKCFIVVDQSAYLGKIVPTDLFLAAIGEEHGFRVEEIIICRKAKTSGQQIQLYPYLRDGLRESIVVLEKI